MPTWRKALGWLISLSVGLVVLSGGPADAHAERAARPAKRPAKSVEPPKAKAPARTAAAKHRASPSAARSRPALGAIRPRSTSAPKSPPPRPRPVLRLFPGRAIDCPADMVAIGGAYCIDRYEGSLADAKTSLFASPFYAPDPALAEKLFSTFRTARESGRPGSLQAMLDVPSPDLVFADVRAVSAPARLPSGYLSGDTAAAACERAGKRLCSEDEWVTACRGEAGTQFPYGPSYVHGACNVYRENHPASLLHGVASRYHRDPRLNLVTHRGEPLLRKTGESSRCASRWGDDAVYDMVGNLDEWIDHPGGVFVGGFYSRGTRAGCSARIGTHARGYFDYSTGVRCCKGPGPLGAQHGPS